MGNLILLLFLAIAVSVPVTISHFKNGYREEYRKKEDELRRSISQERHELAQAMEAMRKEVLDAREQYKRDSRILEEDKKALMRIEEEKTKGFPWLADKLSAFHSEYFTAMEDTLRNKPNPAIKGAEAVKEAKQRAREYERKFRIAQGLLDFYETVVPWLPELQEAPDDAIIKTDSAFGSSTKVDRAQDFLTAGEWHSLPTQDKFQYALDRYWKQNKTRWEIGRLYERFIGYEYELDNWEVEYFGAIKGYEDLGRDLIAKKGNDIHIVQCKNWSMNKVIHEKHIFQLYGTCILYELQNGCGINQVKGIFVTACQLSDMANECAKRLGIDVVENKKLERFPSIKCVNRGDGKIYHLPFDQQYDKIKMRLTKGDLYCETIEEAENSGFRRAFRWTGG